VGIKKPYAINELHVTYFTSPSGFEPATKRIHQAQLQLGYLIGSPELSYFGSIFPRSNNNQKSDVKTKNLLSGRIGGIKF